MLVDVDKAWDKLHRRLKEENLLEPANQKAITVSFFTKMRRVAAVALICVCSGAIVLYLSSKKEKETLVSIFNGEISNTLVSMLEDGSIVFLSVGGVLSCPESFTSDKRQVALHGEAMFDVNSDKNRPFLIETEPALVEVTGTEFNIKSAGKESFELCVLHGSVNVTLKATGKTLQVVNGEMVRLQSGHLQKSLSSAMMQFERYTQKVQFKDNRLEDIVRVIRKLTDKSVSYSDDTLKDMEITIAFDNNTIEEMIGLLCEVLHLSFSDDGSEIIIRR